MVLRLLPAGLSRDDPAREVRSVPDRGGLHAAGLSWNSQAKLTAQPFRFMRLGASFVSNLYNYKGDLPPRDGTGDPTDPWPDYGFGYPYWTAAAYADFTFGNNLLFSLRGGSFYNNTTDQLVQPTPRYVHGGTGNSVFPDIPAEYIRPRGWANCPRAPQRHRKEAGPEILCRRRPGVLSQLRRGACLEVRGPVVADDRRLEVRLQISGLPEHRLGLEPVPHLSGPELRPRDLWLLQRDRKKRVRSATSSRSTRTAGRCIFRTAGRSRAA